MGPAADEGDWGTIKGRIVFGGDAIPERQPVNVDKDQMHCLEKGKILSDEWVVNKDNKGVRYAFVWLVADPNLKNPSKKIPIHPTLVESKEKEVVLDQLVIVLSVSHGRLQQLAPVAGHLTRGKGEDSACLVYGLAP